MPKHPTSGRRNRQSSLPIGFTIFRVLKPTASVNFILNNLVSVTNCPALKMPTSLAFQDVLVWVLLVCFALADKIIAPIMARYGHCPSFLFDNDRNHKSECWQKSSTETQIFLNDFSTLS